MADIAPASLKEVREFFGMTVAEFRKEWTGEKDGVHLTLEDKEHIRFGIADGSLNYTRL